MAASPALGVAVDARFASSRYDGVGRYVVHLLQELVARADCPPLMVIPPPPGEAPREPLPSPGEHLREITPARARAPESPWTHWEVPRLVRRSGAAVFHAPFPLTPLFPGRPMVTTLHDCNPERNPSYYGRLRGAAYLVAVRRALRSSRLIIVPSEMTADDAVRFHRVARERIRVIPMGVDLPPPGAVPADAAARRAALGLEDGYVLVVGRPRPHKGYLRLVEAMSRMPASERPVLVRVGREDPRLPDGHAEAAHRLGVRLRPLVDLSEQDLLAVYRGAGLVAMPSEIEGFGFPVLEAMAAGAPALASDLQPLRASGGDVARYVDGGADAWAEALSRGLADSEWRATAAREGPPRAAGFSWARTAEETLQVYREAAG